MKRSVFLLITAIIAGIFALVMFLAPDKAAEGFGLGFNEETALHLRTIGSAILAAGVLNFIVRNHPDSSTLYAVLMFNVLLHAIVLGVDLMAVSQDVLEFRNIIGGLVAHLFVAGGSLYYMMKMTRKETTVAR